MSNKKWDDPEYRKAYFAAYRAKNKEKISAYLKEYYASHSDEQKLKSPKKTDEQREAARKRASAWYYANKERASASKKAKYDAKAASEYNKKYRLKNADVIRAKDSARQKTDAAREAARKRREKDSEKNVARAKKWAENNPEKIRIARKNTAGRRRARIVSRPFEHIDPNEVYAASGGICGLCGAHVSIDSFEIDHILPIARGGGHTRDNVQVAHRTCNKKKGARLVDFLT